MHFIKKMILSNKLDKHSFHLNYTNIKIINKTALLLIKIRNNITYKGYFSPKSRLGQLNIYELVVPLGGIKIFIVLGGFIFLQISL